MSGSAVGQINRPTGLVWTSDNSDEDVSGYGTRNVKLLAS